MVGRRWGGGADLNAGAGSDAQEVPLQGHGEHDGEAAQHGEHREKGCRSSPLPPLAAGKIELEKTST